MTVRTMPAPRYLGMRYAKPSGGTRLVLWHWTLTGGRRRVNKTDCPACADGKIEVGGGSDVAECLELASFLVRAERGTLAEKDKAGRFADEVVAFLPTDAIWSVDACSIREWVDDIGRVRAVWNRTEHVLPPDDYQPAPLVHAAVGQTVEWVKPFVLGEAAANEMRMVLDEIEGEGF